MANFCSKCGKPLSPEAKFCSSCGAKVDSPVNLSKTTETTNTPIDERGNNSVNGGGRVPDKGFYENFLRRDGRLNRWRYFKRTIVIGLIEFLIILVIFAMTTNALGQMSSAGIIAFKFLLAVGQIPLFCLMVRRLHDCGRDEKLAYASLALNAFTIIVSDYNGALAEPSLFENIIATLSGIIGLYAMFCPGTKGYNQYGEDPLA